MPGLYGYVSATKWVTELKVTTFAADHGYLTHPAVSQLVQSVMLWIMVGMNKTEQSARFIRTRGIQRMWDPRVWGTVVGAAGATVFVFSYGGGLQSPWPMVAVVAWAVAMLAYIILVFFTPRIFHQSNPVGAKSGSIYLGSVVGMLLLIRLGTVVLENADKEALRPALIVTAVGLHFLPFAVAFHTRMFVRLGTAMAILGAVGLLLGSVWDPRAAAAMAVIGGLVMLAMIADDAVRPRRGGDAMKVPAVRHN